MKIRPILWVRKQICRPILAIPFLTAQETMEKLLVVQAMDVSHEVERRADILLNQRYVTQCK